MKKLDEDLVVYTVIEPIGSNVNGRYKLSALLEEGGSYCMPSFEINDKDGIQESDEYWDNEDYLKEMYKILVLHRKRTLNEKELEFIEELKQVIPKDDFEDLILMFDKGYKLGFFEL